LLYNRLGLQHRQNFEGSKLNAAETRDDGGG
jgi:hypothetical protein